MAATQDKISQMDKTQFGMLIDDLPGTPKKSKTKRSGAVTPYSDNLTRALTAVQSRGQNSSGILPSSPKSATLQDEKIGDS